VGALLLHLLCLYSVNVFLILYDVWLLYIVGKCSVEWFNGKCLQIITMEHQSPPANKCRHRKLFQRMWSLLSIALGLLEILRFLASIRHLMAKGCVIGRISKYDLTRYFLLHFKFITTRFVIMPFVTTANVRTVSVTITMYLITCTVRPPTTN